MTGVKRQRIAGFLLSLGYLIPTLAFAETPRGKLPCAADGTCASNSLTYGYYPTRWRKWPIAGPVVPQKKKQYGRGAASESEKAEPLPDAGSIVPLEEKGSEPTDDKSPVPPKDGMDLPPDLPNDLKSDLPQPNEKDLPKLVPGAAGERPELPGLKPPTPNKPSDDDPFKDEPPLEGSPKPAMPRDNSGAQSIRWRTAPLLAARDNSLRQGPTEVSAEEPVRLPEPAPRKTVSRPSEAPPRGKSNPLRTASYDANPVGEQPVTAATGWSEDRAGKPMAMPVGYVNPLRSR